MQEMIVKKFNLAMTEEVQDWTEVLGVTIYQERPTLILDMNNDFD